MVHYQQRKRVHYLSRFIIGDKLGIENCKPSYETLGDDLTLSMQCTVLISMDHVSDDALK